MSLENIVVFIDEDQAYVAPIETPVLVSLETNDAFFVSAGEQGPAGPQGEAGSGVSLEAGEDLLAGDPVYPSGNKLYKASNLDNFGVIGIVREDTLAGFAASAVSCGEVDLAGLNSGSKYYLGDGEITTTVPTSGYIQEIGRAVTSSKLLVDIKQSFLLS
jgi:hypothetical protein